MSDSGQVAFSRQLKEAASIREFGYSVMKGKHPGPFYRKDQIAFSLFNRCLLAHEASEVLAGHSLVDDAWIVVRALVEHAVNCVYMLYVADHQTAADFADYGDYLRYTGIRDLKRTSEAALRVVLSQEDEEKQRIRFEAIRSRFDGKRGDKWCVDDALYKRAAHIDRPAPGTDASHCATFLSLVNTVWRHASTYTHGTSGALTKHARLDGKGFAIGRTYSERGAAQALFSANLALYQVLLPVDQRLGGRYASELAQRWKNWNSACEGLV